MLYKEYRYFYPPRPKNRAPKEAIIDYCNKRFLAQCKGNGSNLTLYTNGIVLYAMNRHGEPMTRISIPNKELLSLCKNKGTWTVINGEYMNKAKKDSKGKLFNHKLIIFDILVIDDTHLIGKSFSERIEILDSLFIKCEFDDYIDQISENMFMFKSFDDSDDLVDMFEKISLIDMYEGFVFKRKRAKLELGRSELNNSTSQIKIRCKSSNYTF
jgi:hypothetical protein